MAWHLEWDNSFTGDLAPCFLEQMNNVLVIECFHMISLVSSYGCKTKEEAMIWHFYHKKRRRNDKEDDNHHYLKNSWSCALRITQMHWVMKAYIEEVSTFRGYFKFIWLEHQNEIKKTLFLKHGMKSFNKIKDKDHLIPLKWQWINSFGE